MISCAVLPALPLQLLARAHPEWKGAPLAVVKEDRANAEVMFVDAVAHDRGIRTGMRHGAAQALVPGLRTGVVAGRELSRAMEDLQKGLTVFTPRVEPASPGVFFLDPTGLGSLYGDHETWAKAVHAYLTGRSFHASVVVGFGRHRTLALARTRQREPTLVLADVAAEKKLCARLPLEAIGASPELRDALAALDVKRVGDLLRLPPLELAARFGHEALVLHAMASDDPARPFSPSFVGEPVRVEAEVDPPDSDAERLLFVIKGALDRAARAMRARVETIVGLTLELSLDHAPKRVEVLRPGAPTLEVPLLVDLIRLRLGTTELAAAVTNVAIVVEGVRSHGFQLAMLEERPKRDVAAAGRALARLRAAFGPDAVVRPELRDAHLPEARFTWVPATRIALPRHVDASGETPLARRLRTRPVALADGPDASEPTLSSELGGVARMHGPYRVTGGWWVREVARDYFYVETGRGDVLWIYRDHKRARWYLHGEVD